ncbi:hypothetical protein ACUSMK_004265 [Escherichia albertii]
MRRSVSVKIGQKEFKSQKAAVGYFMDQREAVKAVGPLKKESYLMNCATFICVTAKSKTIPWATERFTHSA